MPLYLAVIDAVEALMDLFPTGPSPQPEEITVLMPVYVQALEEKRKHEEWIEAKEAQWAEEEARQQQLSYAPGF